jgi:hypothetical protein
MGDMKVEMKTVIDDKCLPWRFPIWQTATAWLLCDRFKIPGWGWGVFWTLIAIVWIATIGMVMKQNKKAIPGFGEEA